MVDNIQLIGIAQVQVENTKILKVHQNWLSAAPRTLTARSLKEAYLNKSWYVIQ